MTESPEIPCCCGLGHTFQTLLVFRYLTRMIAELGPVIRITTPIGTWMVPRIYIAAHGLRAQDLPHLAEKYGWPRLVNGRFR